MYLLDLFGLTLDQIMSIRKVDVYYNNSSAHTETFLEEASQLSQKQGQFMFAHIVAKEFEVRPQGLKPSACRPPNLEDLLAGPVGKAVEPLPADSPGEEMPKPKIAELALGSLENRKGGGKKKPKAKAAATAGAFAAASATQPQAIEDAVSASAKSDRSSKDKHMSGLDEDMQTVASDHISIGSGTSVKCLESLVPLNFLKPPSKEWNNYTAAATLSGVRCCQTLIGLLSSLVVCIMFPIFIDPSQ